VTGPGPNARQAPDRLKLDDPHLYRHDATLCEIHESSSHRLGMWHTHPSATDTPSEADLLVFAHLLDWTRAERVVRIIVTPTRRIDQRDGSRRSSWISPGFACWTVRRAPWTRQAICEPATIAK
jgi:proteasome lid subunit RPN8/RPN11